MNDSILGKICPYTGHRYEPITEAGIYAELQRFHRSTTEEIDDLPWKDGWYDEEYGKEVV
jgi:hypothetical protein